MINNNVKLWLEALRSGDYRQASDGLQVGDKFCCLGVACQIYQIATGEVLTKDDCGDLSGGNLHCHPQVKEWLGLQTNGGRFDGTYKGCVRLTDLNDCAKLSFSEIADFIESEPPGLFEESDDD